uniref:Peptidase S1 domain-containing protein n=1 Tax=Phlebotomus papatasi TaxID=29031 RepID=A0A1B0DN61_PHLPP
MATVTGWGRLKYGGGVPSVLQEVHVPIIDNSVCQEMFQTAGHNKKILKSFLCAGYANDYDKNSIYAGSTLAYPEISTIKEDYPTPPYDSINFPPVRNPNLNTSSNYPSADEEEVVTPTFLEDQKFKDKMDLLVSKIVASLQNNFDSLADVVLERNATGVLHKRPTPKPVGGAPSKKPPTKKPSSKPPQRTTTPAPGAPTRRPTTRPTGAGVARPGVTTRKPTQRPGQVTNRPTRRPTTTLLTTTRKPIQKVTTTVRPTTRPTKRIKTTTIASTTAADDYDTEDVGEEQDGEVSTPLSIEDGRIRCGVRPHVKTARIVGGKSAHFGEFPWQVLVRESTWLGLFTKNKCGGVLISNSYVITAAHCQPGITPKFCKPSKSLPKDDIRAHGPTICMFNHECTQRQGQVVGACMDGFLFGTCCQLQGTVETPLTPPTDDLDDRPYQQSSDRPVSTTDSSQKYTSHYYVNNEAVVVSSPSSIHKVSTYLPHTTSTTPPPQASTKIGDFYLPMGSSPSHYSSEIPTRLSSPFSSTESSAQDYFTASQMNHVTNSLLDNSYGTHFTHSDITHPGADADLIDDGTSGYARPSDFTSVGNFIHSTTIKPSSKNPPPKPEFKPKPKPTTANPNKYVLVHTISNDKPSVKPTIGENDMESIESIILMLNETNTGPQYNAASTPEDRETTFYTTRYPSNYTEINTDKYGPTSFYVTSKYPSSTGKPAQSQKPKRPPSKKPPSTSYVSSTAAVTPRPGATTTKKGTKRPATQKPPSTSYVYSPHPTKRPTSVTVSTSPQKFSTSAQPLLSSTTPTVIVLGPYDQSSSTERLPPEQIIQSKPIEQSVYDADEDVGYGQVSVTQRPSPTVVITPKPAAGSSSPWPQHSRPTKPPSTSYVYSPIVTKRPVQQPTSPYGPSSTFTPGYYRPQYDHTVSSTAIYTAEESDGIYNYVHTLTTYSALQTKRLELHRMIILLPKGSVGQFHKRASLRRDSVNFHVIEASFREHLPI